MSGKLEFKGQPGKQLTFLSSPADIAIYGGSRGGGKSFALLLEALRHTSTSGFSAVIFRRTYPQIAQEGGLWETSQKIYPYAGGTGVFGNLTWRFKKGTTVRFSHMENEDDRYAWLGASVPLIAFDELATFTENQFFFMFGSNRSTCGVRPYIRCTTNPDAKSWVARFIQWWWDAETGYAIEERSGVIRWFIRVKDNIVWGDSKEELCEKYPDIPPKSCTFIPAKVHDNQILLERDPGYLASLHALGEVDRERYLHGNWKISQSSGKIFKREWFTKFLPERPAGLNVFVRYWDVASTEPKKKNKDPDWTCGVLLSLKEGVWYVLDVQRFRGTPRIVEQRIKQTAALDPFGTRIRMEQEPGSPIWEEELVTLSNGSSKKLKEIKINDHVITMAGRSARVEKIHLQGNLSCVEIETQSGRKVIAAKSHPFLTPYGWKEAGALRTGDTLALRCNFQFTHRKQSRKQEDFRLAGYFIGDGCCTKSGESCNAMITCSDKLQAKDIEHCVDALGFTVRALGKQGWHYRIRDGIRDWLRVAGLFGLTTFNKHVPEWVMSADNACVANFIGAYFACDGCVTERENNTSVEFYSTSRQLLDQVQSLLLRFGVNSTIRTRLYEGKNGYTNKKNLHRLTLKRGDDSQSRFAQLIPVFGVKSHKLSKFRRFDFDRDFLSDQIVSVRDIGLRACRCITVSRDESFLVHDIVAHNSGLTACDHYARYILVGYDFKGIPSLKNKQLRAAPVSSAAEAGNVVLIRGQWNTDYIDELTNFKGLDEKNDQVDATSGGFQELKGATGDWKFAIPASTGNYDAMVPAAVGRYDKIGTL